MTDEPNFQRRAEEIHLDVLKADRDKYAGTGNLTKALRTRNLYSMAAEQYRRRYGRDYHGDQDEPA